MHRHAGELGTIAREWFAVMRGCGGDVRELLHDGHPTACVGEAAFGYVNASSAHVNVGFFRGAALADPQRLLQGNGKFMRHAKLYPGGRIDANALRAPIHAAYRDMTYRAVPVQNGSAPPVSTAPEVFMRRVTGIGGIFMSAKDPKALCDWYRKHLGIDVQDWGGTAFTWTDAEGQPTGGTTVWSVGAADGQHFAPSRSTFMVNYRVDDLAALLAALREEGCHVLDKTDDSEYGKFGWVMDPEGNKVELWQPPPGQ